MTRRKAAWTREEVLAALREWVGRYGEVPASTDFHPGDCMRSARIAAARSAAWIERSKRFDQGEYPWPRTVARLFGSWANAVREAGYQPRREAMPELQAVLTVEDAGARIRELMQGVVTRSTLTDIANTALAALEAE